MSERNFVMKENKEKGNNHQNDNQRIIVIGASSGGLEPLKQIVRELPAEFNASIFIVWHMSPDVHGILPHIFSNLNKIPAAHVYQEEKIKPNRIYIAPPDHHLL